MQRAWGCNVVRVGATRCVKVQEGSVCGTQRCKKVPRMDGAWGCRKVPCVVHNGEKVLGDVLVDGRLLLEVS